MEYDYMSLADKATETSVEKNQRIKCGEITLNNKRKISFTCQFCAREVHSIGNFLRHILKQHLIFSQAEIDALLIGKKTKRKHAMKSEQDMSADTMELYDEQDTDYLEINCIKAETESQIKNEEVQMDSNGFVNNFESFVNTCEQNSPKLEQNEYYSYNSSPSNGQIEDRYEEFELLEEFFEAVPAIAKDEIATKEVDFEIELLPYSTKCQQTTVDKQSVERNKRHTTTEETCAMQEINATQTTSTLLRANVTPATTIRNKTNVSQTQNVTQTRIITQATNARQSTNTRPFRKVVQAINIIPPRNARQTIAATQVRNIIKPAINTMQSRQQNTAENIPRIMCKICKKIFKSEVLLSVHLERHAEIKAKTYTCEYCDAQFSHKSNLNVHVKRHLGIKPYGCSFCDKSFTSSTELKLHIIIHTRTKLFKCHECNQQFSRQFQLKSHCRRHYNERPYECTVCGSKFFDSRQLRDHETIHSMERPYSCETCGATFKRRKALREHKKLHLTVKSYECKMCGKTFAQYAGLYAHIKTHKSKTE